MQDHKEDDGEFVERLLKEFGYSWFTAGQAKMTKSQLKELEAKGYLDSSKSTGPTNFRVKIGG
jgi:hypothetical protein